ncbi:hypothetical protein KXV25_003434 [Aspergillus fumigatus]|nr:hypothetical protein CNMCM8714_003716 [Aspergillus fumigatus]KAH1914891.1 hypothetical protein KXW69_006208 [Aspergillus fumigatus]KAH2094355.1 hypothetical protein KXW32_004665 [Aspergillus fumigatus]KAH2533272.1 hypothetical protein KXW12_002835 [Aspergillus fumigatus]KAH2578139.1 hypothetical protein KXV99_002319 [Aspergillus fumigatus]
MDRVTHIIDPDGEVVIILRNANTPFAELDEDMVASIASQPAEVSTPEPAEENGLAPAEQPPEQQAEQQPEEEPEEQLQQPEQPAEDPIEIGGETEDETCFRIQVSAKHLMLASPYFKKLLTGRWRESVAYQHMGSIELPEEGWDINAFLILLRAIHSQHYRIPRTLTVEMLAKGTVLADYYKCEEAISVWTTIWINALEEEIPSTYSRALFLWLWISWYFKLPKQFKQATSTAMSRSDNWIKNGPGLPIPAKVINAMNDRREEAINNLIQVLHDTREALLSGTRGCGFECSSIMYGALSKEMRSNDLLPSRPAAPFANLNYASLVQKVTVPATATVVLTPPSHTFSGN